VIPSGKRLQNRLIVGEGTAGPSRSLRPTLDQLVLVRIQVRQLPKYLQIAYRWVDTARLILVLVLQPNCCGIVLYGAALSLDEARTAHLRRTVDQTMGGNVRSQVRIS
jgi:hypothetical protein